MGRKIDPRDFLLNTDYEMDKIIYFTEGSITASQTTVTIQHKLKFTPLIFGVCSTNSDFSDPRTIPFLYQTMSNTINFEAKANGTSIVISFYDFEHPSARMYYRIYAFEPSNSHNITPTTSKYASQFILNTDYNYCKLCKKGIASGSGTHSIAHNLGYLPQVLVWGENSGYTFPIEQSQPEDPMFGEPVYVAVTNNHLTIRNPDAYTEVHYRIYYDGA